MSKILKDIDKVLEQEEITGDQEVFDMMIQFTTSLDPDQLTEEQNQQLMEIFDYLDPEEEDEELDEVRFLRRTTRAQRKQAKLY